MIEETHPNDDHYIVRVKAVVMTRDDSSGGWLAQEGGGLSRVGVCKVTSTELSGPSDFLIHGERLKDKQVVLECFVRKDLIYTKATPTFHHWKVDNRKCGLTFQSPADARAFDRGVRKALEDITEGSTTSCSTLQNEAELGDDDVFTTATDSSSNSSQKREQAIQPLTTSSFYEAHHHHYILGHFHEQYRSPERYFLDQTAPKLAQRVSFLDEDEEVVRINPRERAWLAGYEDYRHAAARVQGFDSYVQFAKNEAPAKHDYNYPYTHTPIKSLRQSTIGGVVLSQPSNFKLKEDEEMGLGERRQCVYCGGIFRHEENGRGRCPDAPDPTRSCIRRLSCMWCADSLLYHCMSDPEGDYFDPCSCDTADERFCVRWLSLLGLALLAPCLCCYPPLHACHRCAVACGCCGGRHKATA